MDDTDYALGRTNAEYARLIEQAELIRPLTERMLRDAGIRAGMHVLDIGCGAGDVSFLAGELVGPSGSVVGVDLDANALRVADERRGARHVAHVTFLQGDARLAAQGRRFDAAIGRFVLMFMRDATMALRQIADVVTPGGVLAFHEWVASAPSAFPSQPVLASVQDLIAKTFERSGANLDIGAELYSRMREAGFDAAPRPVAEVACCGGEGEVAYRRWSLFMRSMVPKILEYGLAANARVIDELDRRLRDELAATTDLVPLTWLMIGQWARKPA